MEKSRQPLVLVFAGPNGSGKSSITNFVEKAGVYVNADDIQRATQCDPLAAAEQAEKLRYAAIDSRRDLTFETVLSTDRNIKLLEYAKERGYFIKCFYIITTSPSVNIQRVEIRVSQGGHDVPVEKIVSRYKRCMTLIPKLISVCDIINIYDNTVMPTRIFSKKKVSYRTWDSRFWSLERICELTGISQADITPQCGNIDETKQEKKH